MTKKQNDAEKIYKEIQDGLKLQTLGMKLVVEGLKKS